MNIYNKYEKQENILNSNDYKMYLKYLNIFFDDTNENYEKIEDDKYYKLINKKNKANEIILYKSKKINLYEYLNEINIEINSIYEKLSNIINDIDDDNGQFQKLKDQYSKIIIDKKDILKIFKLQNKNLLKFKEDSINLSIVLYKHYLDRKKLFKLIEPVNSEKKNKIIKLYKEKKKILSEKECRFYSKKFNVTFNNLNNWIKWLDSCLKYIDNQIKINKLNNIIKIEEEKNNNINYNFYIHEPMFKENKVIKLKS